MKKIASALFCMTAILSFESIFAQAPGIQWNRLYGGAGLDWTSFPGGKSMRQTTDGGYIIAGQTNSSQSGDVTGTNHDLSGSTYDIWIVKLDVSGNIQWNQLLGGSAAENATDIQQTADGGYIIAGSSTSSASGDVTGTNHGNGDIWIVKLDANGNKQWDKLMGSAEGEAANAIRQTADGGYIIAGFSNSPQGGGDITGANHSPLFSDDYWIIKLDAAGNKQWDKLYGGDDYDRPVSVVLTADGGYLFAGDSRSSQNGDVSGANHGDWDFWLLKLDAAGNKQWDKLLGGTAWDLNAYIEQAADGGYILVGSTLNSQSGDISGTSHGGWDYWVAKLDATGTITWDKLLGGNGLDQVNFVRQLPDGGYILAGISTSSQNGDITGTNLDPNPFNKTGDTWLVKLDGSGNKKWERLAGGVANESNPEILPTTDGGYILNAASESSQSGDVTAITHGNRDLWLVKFLPDPSAGSLPLTMLSFTARQLQEKVWLNWSTASEQNTKDFIVQRSTDGIAWSNIGSVNAAGNSSTVQQYSFWDTHASYGNNIYRLLQEDLDNSFTLSETRIVHLSGNNAGLRILGNPVTNNVLQLQLPSSSIITIVSMQGITMYSKQLNAGRQNIPLNNFPGGTYTIKAGLVTTLFVVQ